MAVTSAPFTANDLQYTIPEIWPGILNEPDFAKAVFTGWFRDLSEFMVEGGDIANIPDIYTNSFTVQTQSTQGAEVTTTSPAQANAQLNVNTHKYIAYIIGDKDALQLARNYDLNVAYARQARGLLMEEIEADMAALWSDISTSVVADTATVLTDYEIRAGLSALESLDVDLSDVAIIVHPVVFWKQLAGVTKYYKNDESNLNFVMTGNFGDMSANRAYKGVLYDVPVFTSTKVVGALQTYRNIMAHRNAFGFAIQSNGTVPAPDQEGVETPMRLRVQASYELRNLGTLTVVDVVYGVKTLRESYAVLLNANTSANIS